jgi:hypothetical protein
MRNHSFQERLYSRWADALDLYETALFVAQNIGREFNGSYRAVAAAMSDARFEVLNRLYANALLIGGEIYQLLLGGFASGAHARWRTLHEISVVIRFIELQEPDTAEAFLLHREVRAYEEAQGYRKHQARLGVKPISDEGFRRMRQRAEQHEQRYGKQFRADFGWALPAIRKMDAKVNRVGLHHLEKAVSSEHWNPHYRMANHAIHATSNSLRFNMGVIAGSEVILAGPSNGGLADPGQNTLLSLASASTVLISCGLRIGNAGARLPKEMLLRSSRVVSLMAQVQTLSDLAVAAAQEFITAHRRLEAEERERRASNLAARIM